MLRIQNLEKSYGSQVLFEDASLQMTAGERLGLIGRNGHGKSTLFRLILGEERPDEGSIIFPRNYRIGHLAQHLHFTKPTVLEEGCLGLLPEEEHDHYKVEEILFGLGFTQEDMDRPPELFSGGYQIRLNLAKVLVSHPNLLLLDEPTNYLDIVSIRWIISFLKSWKDELIVISHDRDFMDQITTHTALIHRQKIRKVQGGTEKLYQQIAQEEEVYEKTRVNEEKQRKQIEAFVNRFRAQATKAAAVQSRVKMLEKMPSKEKLSRIADLDFAFHYSPFEAKTIMEARDLSFGYKPEDAPLIRDFSLTIQAKDRIAIIGKNGKGKSTLLNLMASELTPGQGEIKTHPNLKLGYFGQTNIQRLNPKSTPEEEIMSANSDLSRTAARTICGIMMFSGDQAEKKVEVLSGGEKSRVLLGKILATPANLLFLDEPTNHLDMQSIEALVESIEDFDGAVVIVTHSEMILKRLATKLVLFQHGNAEIFDGSYEDFLERVGWEEEGPPKKKAPKKESIVEAEKNRSPNENKNDVRKKRAQFIADRSKELNPLKNQITQLENLIVSLEKILADTNNALLEASQYNQIDQYVKHSRQVKETQKKIDDTFDELEKTMRRHDERNRHYEDQLKEMGE